MPIPDVSSRSLADLLSLGGRVALVTGGARGIGLASARRLAEAGAAVAVADLDKAAAETAAAEIAEAHGTKAIGVEIDVSDTASVEAAFDRTTAELSGLDILVNNAGIFPIFPVLPMPDEEWDRVMRTNLYGSFYCARAAGRLMADRGGVIVNMVSVQAFKAGTAGLAHYTTSKAALVGFTKALAVELGPFNIRVLGVAPTVVDTPGLQANMPIFEASGVSDVIEMVSKQLPLGRTAVPDDVARVVVFAASDLAALMTGDILMVDGGHLLI
ncbi:MAG TPA: SDR family NAD(P)-dependent oxidoreductase [Acidimicrobiia bacterium]|jgi:NAD(P)-dependent dehydrogenase (short-subunit alcohol dehydrogenase family)|nr:SDR family NAD(P)-dependent oxidoreductase [Acidimicrobiia bacterium]